jgi:hypothetical protein
MSSKMKNYSTFVGKKIHFFAFVTKKDTLRLFSSSGRPVSISLRTMLGRSLRVLKDCTFFPRAFPVMVEYILL